MARLFIGSRELDFFNDIAREVTKDIAGQRIIYYSLAYAKMMVHDIYKEAPERIFDQPLEIAARVEWTPSEVTTTAFGHDELRTITVFLHVRDLIARKINVHVGDYISYGDTFYEVVSAIIADTVYGEVEYSMGWKLTCIQARDDEFLEKVIGPTSESYSDPDAVQASFHQQRGYAANAEGPTGDERDLVKKGVLDPGLEGPREVSPAGSDIDDDSAFYDT